MERSTNFARESAAKLSGVILAGGTSSRFGSDKSQMKLAGKKVLERLLEVFQQFPFQRLVLITSQGKGGDWPKGVIVLPDDQEGLGPIGGITTALRRLPGDILVAACDMPLVSVPFIEWLLGHYDPGVDAVIPRHSKGIEPLLGIYEKSFLPALEKEIGSNRYALHRILKKGRVRYVDVPTDFSVKREFANVNTPEDYSRVETLLCSIPNRHMTKI